MNPLHSIRARLMVLTGLLLFLMLGGFGYIAWHREVDARIAAVDRELEERLNLLITGFRPDARQRLNEVHKPRLSPRALGLFSNEGGEPYYYYVWLSDDQIQARSDEAPDMQAPERSIAERVIRLRDDKREIFHFTPTGRCFLIGRSFKPERDAMQKDAAFLATLGSVMLLLGLTFSWWIATRVTRPLVEVSRAAREIASGDLSQRIQLNESKDEIGSVARVLNDTFSRLEAAFERQKQFTVDASHELRTPLSLILTHAQGALLHEQSAADYREALTDITHAAKRMKTLVETLLDLARFDADAEAIQLEPCDLGELTRDCVALLSPLAHSKHIHLNLDLQPAFCRADSTRLGQVIINLLTNAIHFTPDNGTITLRTFEQDGANFTIADTGPGIPFEQQSRLFERFYRGDPSRTRGTGSVGLGLAICKAIVNAHGGEIEYKSAAGKRSTFIVRLPLSR